MWEDKLQSLVDGNEGTYQEQHSSLGRRGRRNYIVYIRFCYRQYSLMIIIEKKGFFLLDR